MKLRTLIAYSLTVYVTATVIISVVGFWILPGNEPASAPRTDTTTASASATAAASGQEQTASQTSSTPQASTTTGSTDNPTSGSQAAAPAGSSGTAAPAPSPAPTPAPAPVPACGTAGGTCTSAQIATHDSASNCWVIYNNKYYIVSSYVSKHPGGTSVFNSQTCGHDITGYLNGTLGTAGQRQEHPTSAYNILNSYYIGPVSG